MQYCAVLIPATAGAQFLKLPIGVVNAESLRRIHIQNTV